MKRPPVHPGEYVAETLDDLDMSARELAVALDIPANRITEIVCGRRGISADTALRLGRWLGTGPDVWMNLQKTWELRTAEQEHGAEIERNVRPRDLPVTIAR
jgi:addiction module HigA family antidote